MLVRAHAKVLHRLSCILGPAQEQRALAGRRPLGQLVKGERLAARLDNARARPAGVLEGGAGELGQLQQAHVVRDGADHDDGGVRVAPALVDDLAEGDGGPVDPALVEALEHLSVEWRVCAAGEEAVQLHQQGQVDIGAGGRLPLPRLLVVFVQVDSH